MTKNDLLLEQWKTASQLHRHEDELAYKKLQYFATIHGILVSALGVILSRTPAAEFRIGAMAICGYGLVTSVVWFLIHKRGQMYHKFRAAQAANAERELRIDGDQVLNVYSATLKEQSSARIRWFYTTYSIHGLIGWLALFLVFIWLLAVLWLGAVA